MGVVFEEVEASVNRARPTPAEAGRDEPDDADDGLELKLERILCDRQRRAARLEAD